jgi:hypothetical protein
VYSIKVLLQKTLSHFPHFFDTCVTPAAEIDLIILIKLVIFSGTGSIWIFLPLNFFWLIFFWVNVMIVVVRSVRCDLLIGHKGH